MASLLSFPRPALLSYAHSFLLARDGTNCIWRRGTTWRCWRGPVARSWKPRKSWQWSLADPKNRTSRPPGEYVRRLGIEDDRLVIPVGYLRQMEANLERDPKVQLLVASRAVEGKLGPGQGFTLKGTGSVVTSGEDVERVKSHFPWARAALIIEVSEAIAHL